MINNYIIKKLIGSGSFGQIHLAYDKVNKCNVAIKKIFISDFKTSTIDMIITEIKIGYLHNCSYIAKIKDFFLDFTSKTVYIIMDYYDQSDMNKLKKKRVLSREERRNFVFNLLYAIQYLHINKVIHRDIKLENILINKNTANLSDFGTCRILPDNKYFTSTCIGTPYYLSPEIINGDKYNTKVDIYSLGCVLCELYYNKLPYKGNNIGVLYKNVLEAKKNVFIDNTTIIGKLINRMLSLESYDRPLIEEVLEIMNSLYNVKENKTFKKDSNFYNNIRRKTNIPRTLNELDIFLKGLKKISPNQIIQY